MHSSYKHLGKVYHGFEQVFSNRCPFPRFDVIRVVRPVCAIRRSLTDKADCASTDMGMDAFISQGSR